MVVSGQFPGTEGKLPLRELPARYSSLSTGASSRQLGMLPLICTTPIKLVTC